MSKIKTIWQKFKKIIIGFLIGGTALAAGLSGIPQDLYNNLNVKVYSACNLQEAKITSIADSLTTLKARNPDDSLRELNAEERANVKTCEMAKRGTELRGFGADGSVEIERFRIYNPPILVDDPNGTIIREWTDEITKE